MCIVCLRELICFFDAVDETGPDDNEEEGDEAYDRVSHQFVRQIVVVHPHGEPCKEDAHRDGPEAGEEHRREKCPAVDGETAH